MNLNVNRSGELPCNTCYEVDTYKRITMGEGYVQMYCEQCRVPFDLSQYLPTKMPICAHTICG